LAANVTPVDADQVAPRSGRDLQLLGLLAFTALIAGVSFGTRPLISYLAVARGAGPAEIGLIASSFGVLATVFALPLGRLVDTHGERPIMFGGGVVCLAACVLVPSMTTISLLAVATALMGLGQLMAVIGAQTMLATRQTNGGLAFSVGLYSSAASVGHALGPIAVGFLLDDDLDSAARTAMLGASIASALAAGLALAMSERHRRFHTHREGQQRLSPVQTIRLRGMLPALVAGLVSLTAIDLLIAYLPVYGVERDIRPQTIGLALGVLALAQVLARVCLGRLLRRFSHADVLAASIAVAAVSLPTLAAADSETVLVVVMALAGLGFGLAQPLTMLWIATAVPARSRGLAMGMRMGGNRLGQILVPFAVGATVGQVGVGAILVTIALMLAASGGYVARSRRQFAPAVDDEYAGSH
jgi:MFS family permease